jgi:hypothetical protein
MATVVAPPLRSQCPSGMRADRSGVMWQDADHVDVSRALFRQRFQITVQRRLLGCDLSHVEAAEVLTDDDRLEVA